jgi:hypothetical protein
MVERVMSKKKSRERILIKNSLVIKGNVVSNTASSVFLCMILRVPVVVFFLPEAWRALRDTEDHSFTFAVFSNQEGSNP